MFGRPPSLVLRSLIFMLPAISRLVMLDCSSQLSVLRDPIGHLDEKGLLPVRRSREDRKIPLPMGAGISAAAAEIPSSALVDPTQLHDFPLLVDGRPTAASLVEADLPDEGPEPRRLSGSMLHRVIVWRGP